MQGIQLVQKSQQMIRSIQHVVTQATNASLPYNRTEATMTELKSLVSELQRHTKRLNGILQMYDLKFLFSDMLVLLDKNMRHITNISKEEVNAEDHAMLEYNSSKLIGL